MILYFSATENCKYVATRLAQDGGQEMRSIVDCMRDGRYAFEGESIGIVSPTYFWGLPVVVREFLSGFVPDGIPVFRRDLRNHARRGRRDGRKSHTGAQNRRV